MKPILREYLASLREREELDAIIPDLISELGYTVFSRPGRGTIQHGVDIAALGPEHEGERKVYLFSVKRGDLGRQDWNGGPQALRPSLDDIQDAYIGTRIPPEHAGLRIVICICLGGDVQETVRTQLTGYIENHTTDRISFEEWNGDRIAGLLLEGVLREELLPRPLRSHFQKSVAMVDEPEVAYGHFDALVRRLVEQAGASDPDRVRAARQIYVCLWVLFVWARDAENLEAPYRASELAILAAWDLLRSCDQGATHARALAQVLHQLIRVHVDIAVDLLGKVTPHVGTRDALSVAVRSQSDVDVNLALFEVLGRIAMTGLWVRWMAAAGAEATDSSPDEVLSRHLCEAGLALVENNRTLHSPACDDQATDMTLFLILCLQVPDTMDRVSAWLGSMTARLEFAFARRIGYPRVSSDYADLLAGPRDRSEAGFLEATAGSTIVPLLAIWTNHLGRSDLVERLAALVDRRLRHCTLQLWMPNARSEELLYLNGGDHGSSLVGLAVTTDGQEPLRTVRAACRSSSGLGGLSACLADHDPVVLLACRHWRLPVPPGIYVDCSEQEDVVVEAGPETDVT